MSISSIPLSYCTNVHAGTALDDVRAGAERYARAVQQAIGRPLGVGLWLAARAAREAVERPDVLDAWAEWFAASNLVCYTLNAFPYGDFHSERVKDSVYSPDWRDPARPAYTLDCANVLARLLSSEARRPESQLRADQDGGIEGSISTLPLGFKRHAAAGAMAAEADPERARPAGRHSVELRRNDMVLWKDYIAGLLAAARGLAKLRAETGKTIRLAVEPEPLCLLETTEEAIRFFGRLWEAADAERLGDVVREHVGLCYDVCHQAVEFEDVAGSIRALHNAGVRINKVHVTCALHLDRPGENEDARRQLAEFVEPRYLHQTFALAGGRTSEHAAPLTEAVGLRGVAGRRSHLLAVEDLTAPLALDPPEHWRQAEAWRVHFHVPVHVERLGALGTTRADLIAALKAVAGLPYAPHLEVETYTWGVLPEQDRRDLADSLVAGLTAEMTATQTMLDDL